MLSIEITSPRAAVRDRSSRGSECARGATVREMQGFHINRRRFSTDSDQSRSLRRRVPHARGRRRSDDTMIWCQYGVSVIAEVLFALLLRVCPDRKGTAFIRHHEDTMGQKAKSRDSQRKEQRTVSRAKVKPIFFTLKVSYFALVFTAAAAVALLAFGRRSQQTEIVSR